MKGLRAISSLLRNLALGSGLHKALLDLAEFVEQQRPGAIAAVHLLEADGRLHLAAAPRFGSDCAEIFGSLEVGPQSEASGLAAARRDVVVVEDISTDPLFDDYRAPLSGIGMQACCAAPILPLDGRVLGTLAVYFPQAGAPEAEDLALLQLTASIAVMVIAKFEATRALRDNEERARALVEYSADALLRVDANGIVHYATPMARKLFGVGDDRDLTGESALSFVHPDQQQWLTSVFRKATRTSGVSTHAFRVIREDSSVRWLEITMTNQLQHPVLQSMILNYHDITDRVEALDRLWEQEERYRAIVDGVTDAILILDLSGNVVTANRAATELYGYPLTTLIGTPVTDLVGPADRVRLESFAEAAALGKNFYAECVGLRQDRSDVHVVIRGASLLMNGIPHLLAVISNVSEQKRMQQRLELTDRISSLGRMAATIAHEMNNVMMGIVPFAEIIKRRSPDDPVLLNAVTQILKSVERGKGVTQNILRFTRATGKPSLEPVDGGQLLAAVAEELRLRLAAPVTLDVAAEPGVMLLGDATQLQQVIVNLVVNGADAMPDGGEVNVRLSSCSDQAFSWFGAGGDGIEQCAHLSVTDHGHGIAPYVMSHIFEPLFTTKGSAGTGLGLAIAHQIVIAHSGQIHVESAPGRGTTFHVLLRKASTASRASANEDRPDVWRSIRTVVLVEDDRSVGEGLVGLLSMENVACEWLTTGELALARLRSNPPDLLILDVGLPDISGVEVYRQVAQWHPQLPTLFSTGHGDHRLLDEFDPVSPVAFLSKPYGIELLTMRVQSLVEARTSTASP